MAISKYQPGVYSEYSITTAYQEGKQEKTAAVMGDFGLAGGTAVKVSLGEPLPLGKPLIGEITRLFFQAGAQSLWLAEAAPNATAAQWTAGLAGLADKELGLLVCQSDSQEVLAAVKTFVAAQSAQQKELIAVAGCGDISGAAALAKALNSERMVLTWGVPTLTGGSGGTAFHGAAALGAALAVMEDPSLTLSGETLAGLASVATLNSYQIDTLLEAGVTPLGNAGQGVEVLRGVTTKTTTGVAADRSLTPINAILIIDYVMKALRGSLKGLLRGAKNTPQTLSAVASQLTLLLESLSQRSIITQYQAPKVSCPKESPDICVAEVSFTAAYLINQIHIQAHIQL